MIEDNTESLFVPTFVARQPIFDAKQNIWGYELFYRHSSEATAAIFTDEESATLAVAACASCQQMDYALNSKILVNFTEKSIVSNVPLALPANVTVLEIDEQSIANPAFLESLERLKHAGYHIAVDKFEGRKENMPLLALADLLKIDTLGKSDEQLLAAIKLAQSVKLPTVATRIEHFERYKAIKKLGFTYFQGFFFQKPEMVEGRKLAPTEIARLNLFKLIESEDPDFDKLTSAVQSDVAISYSLLSYLNSPAFGLRQKVQSIKHALVLLGWKNVKSWLRVAILADMNPKGKSSELPYHSIQRGRFFQLAAVSANYSRYAPESLFLLGLFSLLSAMLSLPMEKVVANLPLDNEFKDALCGRDNALRPWLDTAIAFETANWDGLEILLGQLGLDPVNTAQAYYESIAWASRFYQKKG